MNGSVKLVSQGLSACVATSIVSHGYRYDELLYRATMAVSTDVSETPVVDSIDTLATPRAALVLLYLRLLPLNPPKKHWSVERLNVDRRQSKDG